MKLKMLALGAALVLAIPAAHAQKVLKYAHFQPAKDDQPKHVAALAFKEHVEKSTNGSIKVEIYPAGQFGKDQQGQRYEEADVNLDIEQKWHACASAPEVSFQRGEQ